MNKELLDRLGSPYAISLRVWLWSTPVVIAGTSLTFGAEIFLHHTQTVLLMGLAAHVYVGLISAIASLTYLKKSHWDRPKPALVLPTYVAMGIGRGLIISSTALITEIPAPPDFFGRAISSAWVFFFWATILTLVLESSERYKRLLAEVDTTLEEIASIQSIREVELSSVRSDFIAQVNRTLGPALDRARNSIDLVRLSNTLIEPDSYAALKTQIQTSRVLRQQASNLGFADVVRHASSLRFPAALIAILATAALSPPLLYRGGLFGLLQLIVMIFSIFVSIRLLRQPRRPAFFTRWLGAAAILVGGLMVAASFDSQNDGGEVSLSSLSVGMLLVALFLIFLHALDQQRDLMVKRLSALVRQLRVGEAKLQQELALERMELAQLVHSEIQGRLRAAAVLAQTTYKPVDMQRLKDECIQALTSGRRSQSMKDFLDEFRLMWTPGLTLKIDIDDASSSALAADSYLRKAFQAIVREGVINAVKHGDARTVAVSASLVSPDNLQLIVSNDGRAPLRSRRSLGSQLLDDLTSSWSLASEGAETILLVVLPVVTN